MRLKGITRNVLVLGWVSFFTDLASEMLYPIIPLFVTAVLGAPPAILGLIDGLAEGISSGLRWIGGALSDRLGRRKPFITWGYGISALSKPIMGMAVYAVGWPLFLVGRCSDRLGKSIRTSARDALIADSTDPEYRGVAFGLHRAMDTAGAILGPLAALLILIWLAGSNRVFSSSVHGENQNAFSNLPLAWLFFVALVPGLASVFLAAAAAKDIPHAPKDAPTPPLFQRFPAAFWHLIAANAVFSLGNSSDTFLILRSSEVGLSLGHVILAFALYNGVYALAAMPLGKLSDRIGRKPVIVMGWLAYAGVYAGFAAWNTRLAPWVLLCTYGLYQAFTEGVTKALVSDVVAKEQRAGAIGMYYTISGFGQLAASLLAGAIWSYSLFDDRIKAPFAVGALLALLAIPIIATVRVRPAADLGRTID